MFECEGSSGFELDRFIKVILKTPPLVHLDPPLGRSIPRSRRADPPSGRSVAGRRRADPPSGRSIDRSMTLCSVRGRLTLLEPNKGSDRISITSLFHGPSINFVLRSFTTTTTTITTMYMLRGRAGPGARGGGCVSIRIHGRQPARTPYGGAAAGRHVWWSYEGPIKSWWS